MEKSKYMEEIEFELESICPLLMDKWVDAEQPKTKDGWLKQADMKAYRNKDSELIIPATALKATIKLAANELVGVRKGKSMRQTIMACLFIGSDMSIGKNEYDEIREDIVTRKGTGDKVTRVATYRPMINEWNIKGTIHYVSNGGLTPEFIEQALELAGFKYGLLGYRPEFGRFIIKRFELKT